ncbi:MAG TPA: three-Cys-motif partner protein TcmP [Ignavibacteriaceae bacterium]|nr:three-Cys-motif partner protein TcmP [Ignavibacteriaceae bacterium]
MGKSTKEILEEHSKSKVELLNVYLGMYLNILERVKHIKTVLYLDLFAGEGIYKDGSKGSSITAIETFYKHLEDNNLSSKEYKIFLNDSEKSIIEKNIYKVDRIKSLIDNKRQVANLIIKYEKLSFSELLPKLIDRFKKLTYQEKALVFIDPWGYKDINPSELKKLLSNDNVEVLLFIPIFYMYRFAVKTIRDDFPEGKAIKYFLNELFSGEIPDISSAKKLINNIKIKFKRYMEIPYVQTFVIERDKTNVYCLFFFTHNKLGYQKMVEAKWRIDKNSGRGFKGITDPSFFEEYEAANLVDKILKFIDLSDGKTNEELKDFGYDLEFLPRDVNKCLNKLFKENKITRISLDGKDVNGFYLEDKSRTILVKII